MKVKIVSPGSSFNGRIGERVEKAGDGRDAWWVRLDGDMPAFPMMFNERELEDVPG